MLARYNKSKKLSHKKLGFFLEKFLLIIAIILSAQAIAIAQTPEGFYNIQNKNSGRFLAVSGSNMERGASIIQWQHNKQDDVKWELVFAGHGYFKIKNDHSGKFLAISGGKINSGADVIQWDDNNQDDIKWKLIDLGDGYYKLQNKNSGKFLAVAGGQTINGAGILQWDDNNQEDIKWRLSLIIVHKGQPRDWNVSVPDVQRQFSRLSQKSQALRAWSVNGVKDKDYKKNTDNATKDILEHKVGLNARDGQSGIWQMMPNQISNHGERCHFQGIQRLRVQPYIALVYNASDYNKGSSGISGNDCEENRSDWGGAHLVIVKMGSKSGLLSTQAWGTNTKHPGKNPSIGDLSAADRVATDVVMQGRDEVGEDTLWHPSGFQVVGDYLAVAVYGNRPDSELQLWDLSNPENPKRVWRKPITDKRILAVGAVLMKDLSPDLHVWLFALKYKSKNDGQLHIDFYEATGASLVTAIQENFHRVNDWDSKRYPLQQLGEDFKFKSFSSINLIRERTSNYIYLIGTYRDGPNSILGGGSQKALLFRVEHREPLLETVRERKLDCDGHCNFSAAAGGVYISPGGHLALYGGNHYANSKDKFELQSQYVRPNKLANIKMKWLHLKFAEFW